jgi:hypothetical protein
VLVTAIYVFFLASQDVDGRDSACGRPGHDDVGLWLAVTRLVFSRKDLNRTAVAQGRA